MLSNENTQTVFSRFRIITAVMAVLGLALISGCQKSNDPVSVQEELTDAELILAIQEASTKQDIKVEQLPAESKNVLQQDYSDSYVDDAKIAPELGYEIGMRNEKGTHIRERSQTYFNLSGRELRAERDPDQAGGRGDRGDDGRKECFTLVYPVIYVMPDGSTITGTDEKEVCAAIRSWYKANPDSHERPTLQYPVSVILEDGTSKTINNEDEMKSLIENCGFSDRGGDSKRDKEPCFEYVYPVTYIMPDGSTITVENEDGEGAIRRWYEANPDSKEEPALQYPVGLVFEDGTILTVNNDEEMRGILAQRHGDKERDKEPCFEFVYPITYIMPDGSTITVENEDGEGAIRSWYEAHSDSKEKPTLQYPVDVTLKDGTTVTVNNDEELRAIYAGCDDGRG